MSVCNFVSCDKIVSVCLCWPRWIFVLVRLSRTMGFKRSNFNADKSDMSMLQETCNWFSALVKMIPSHWTVQSRLISNIWSHYQLISLVKGDQFEDQEWFLWRRTFVMPWKTADELSFSNETIHYVHVIK